MSERLKRCANDECDARLEWAMKVCPECGTEQPRIGRPYVEIDWDTFDQLCAMQCTLNEIAAVFKCSAHTVERACKRDHGRTFVSLFKEKRQDGMSSLRRQQYLTAMGDGKGATTMQIWLGKQWLKQRDKPVDDTGDSTKLELVLTVDGAQIGAKQEDFEEREDDKPVQKFTLDGEADEKDDGFRVVTRYR